MFLPPQPLHYRPNMASFPSPSVGMVKLDLTFEAGSRYQPQPCVAHAANQLMGEATGTRSAEEVAEFLDFRGIILERSADTCTACLSFYFLRRYASELLPLVREMVEQPRLTAQLFEACCAKRRQQLQTNALKTAQVARNRYYSALFGAQHPLGVYAVAEDVDRLTPQHITDYWRQHYSLAQARILLAGAVDDQLLSECAKVLLKENAGEVVVSNPLPAPATTDFPVGQTLDFQLPTVNPQATIRVGRILPLAWDDPDYARFMVLNTVLGGYFGSRLMSNLREEKGYTYGIYSQTQIFRGIVVQFITADVAASAATDALRQVDNELRRLQQEPVPQEELERVCTYMRGDFLRSVDGIFEVSERYRQMVNTAVDEHLTENLFQALETVTPDDLMRLARQYLSPNELLHVTVTGQ